MLLGLVTTSSMKVPWLQVEGDSLIIIQAYISRQIQCRNLAYKLKHAWRLIDTFENCFLNHTYREGNKLVDYLSNLGCDGKELDNWDPTALVEIYPNLLDIINKETSLS